MTLGFAPHRMAKDGVQPNTKTFTALISSVGKMSTIEQAMDIINELLSHETEPANLTQTYSALMSACEKAGQWDLAVALFDRMSNQVCAHSRSDSTSHPRYSVSSLEEFVHCGDYLPR